MSIIVYSPCVVTKYLNPYFCIFFNNSYGVAYIYCQLTFVLIVIDLTCESVMPAAVVVLHGTLSDM